MRKSAKSLSLHSILLWKLMVAALLTVLTSGTLWAQNQIATGKKITPAGFNGEIASLPMNIVSSPDGKFAITSDMGFHQELSSIDTGTGQTTSEVQFENTSGAPHNGLYYGVAFAPGNGPDYTLYAAQGENQTIAVLSLSAAGDLTQMGSIATKAGDFPSGLATDKNGYLYVANNDPDTFAVPGSVAIYGPNGNEVGRYRFTASYGGTPNFPLAIATLQDGSKTYVASQRDGTVYVLNTIDPTNPKLAATIVTGSHPTGLLFNQSQSLLYVANAHSDSISVVSTSTDSVQSTLQFQFNTMKGLYGATPIAVGLSPDQKTLYAAMADLNALAVADVNGTGLTLRGYIPVGWYPTGVVVSPDGKRLLAINAKGVKTRIPSTGYVQWQFNDNPWYDLNTIIGTVSLISVPTQVELLAFTNQVFQNNGLVNPSQAINPNDRRLASIGLKAGKITHVIYIVKENRTYDQVLGDLPQGNGDPSLVLFGNHVTPSLHALAQRFVLLDNFYDAGEASGDGWPWSTQSMANEYVIKNLPYNYSGRGRNYDFEGQDNGYPAGGFPAKDPYGNQLSQQFPNGVPPIPDVAEAPGGHIWDAVQKAKLSYRNYGFYYTFGVSGVIPDNYPASAGLQPAGHDLGGVSDFDYRRYDNQFPDSEGPPSYGCLYRNTTYGHYNMPSRFSEWNREFQEMLQQDPSGNSVPAFMTVRFNHDHTEGYTSGNFSPSAEVADNDYAVGQLVDTISKSPIWQHTAIFVIEDDAQDGPDHVDAHRSTAYVISPYIYQGRVDHTFYNTDSILKTMELLLGVTPLTQYDAIANSIAAFDTQPSNGATFNAVEASQDVMCQKVSRFVLAKGNPMRKWALESAKMNFDIPDSAPSAKLNEVLWKSIKGPDSKMPKIRHNVITATDKD
jgi:YVTN family beta-propeller protein